jgi:hypothetical protein
VTLAQSDLCVPAIGSGLAPQPTIDGRVDGDPGWAQAMRVNLKELMGVPRVGSMQLGRVGNFMYISFEVEGMPTPAYDDLVVLGFSTTSDHTQDWRVHIHPFTTDDIGSGRSVYQDDVPRTQDYWRNSTNWNFNTTDATTPGTANTPSTPFVGEIKVSRNTNNWAMEIKIPTSSNIADAAGNTLLYIPTAGTFRLYVNVLSTFDLLSTFTQDPWPHGVQMLTSGAAGSGGNYAANRTPGTSLWAVTSIFSRPQCSGLYLTWNSSNGVRQTPTGSIGYSSHTGPGPFRNSGGTVLTTVGQCEADLGNNTAWPTGTILPDNYYVAKPGNSGTTPANRVYVKFYVAPWGIPGAFDAGAPNAYWHPLGELYQPTGAPTVHSTTPEANVPTDAAGGLAAPLSTPSWQLSYKQACVYTKSAYYGNLGHHCIQAEVHSNDPTVVVQNKSVVINHNFVEASAALREAMISVKGRGRRPPDQVNQQMILLTSRVIQRFSRDGAWYYPGAGRADTIAARSVASGAIAIPAQFRAWGPVPAERYPGGLTEGMTVITNGYLRRGDDMIIGSKSYRYAQYVGGFSYFAGHAGAASKWIDALALADEPGAVSGASFKEFNLKALEERTPRDLPIRAYALELPEEKAVTLAVRVEAQEQAGVLRYKWWIILLAAIVVLIAFLRRRRSNP